MTKSRFTEEVIDQMRAMRAMGASASEIAIAIGSTENSVKVTCWRLKIPTPVRNSHSLSCMVTPQMAKVFIAAAVERGLTDRALLRLLLHYIIKDSLFDAIIE